MALLIISASITQQQATLSKQHSAASLSLAETAKADKAPARNVAVLLGVSGREQDVAGALLQLLGPQLLCQLPALLSMPAEQAPPSPLPSSLEESSCLSPAPENRSEQVGGHIRQDREKGGGEGEMRGGVLS